MDTKGQAFSTFQLLIAAVVALAILVLLLNIIGSLPFITTQKPLTEAVNLIKSQVNSPSELRTSNPVVFSRGDSLNAKAIANGSGVLTENQVCISKGDHIDTQDFTFPQDEGKVLIYNGNSIRVKLSVVCDTASELSNDLLSNGINDDWTSGCDFFAVENQTACVVALRFA